MRTYSPITVGPAPTAFSTGHAECGRTVLNLQTDTVTLVGDLECRRRAARVFAKAVGLEISDPADTVVATGSIAGLEHLVAAASAT